MKVQNCLVTLQVLYRRLPAQVLGLMSLIGLFCGTAYADAPVVDLTSQVASYGSSQQVSAQSYVDASGNTPDRIKRLEQKVNNLVAMSLPDQIEDLRSKVQQLQGEVDLLTHQLKQLSDNQARYYKDLDARLGQNQSNQQTKDQKSHQDTGEGPEDQEQSALYQEAFGALQIKRYEESEKLFRQYLKQSPRGKYAANAHYWLGELYYVDGQTNQAKMEMKLVADQFPQSSKVPAAQLKLALIHLDENQIQKAKGGFQQIVKQYPDSSAANLARRYLKQLASM